jgi:hypothetical protein
LSPLSASDPSFDFGKLANSFFEPISHSGESKQNGPDLLINLNDDEEEAWSTSAQMGKGGRDGHVLSSSYIEFMKQYCHRQTEEELRKQSEFSSSRDATLDATIAENLGLSNAPVDPLQPKYKCSSCGIPKSTLDELRRHETKCYSPSAGGFTAAQWFRCFFCTYPVVFPDLAQFLTHFHLFHSDDKEAESYSKHLEKLSGIRWQKRISSLYKM